MSNNIMATPLPEFDIQEAVTKFIEFFEKVLGSAPGAKKIKDMLGLSPENLTIMDLFSSIVVLVSLIVGVGILYAIIRISQIQSKDRLIRRELAGRGIERKETSEWKKIKRYAESDNPNDWKLALREADILLDVVVSDQGYRGTTFEEKVSKIKDNEDALKAHEGWYMYIQKGGDNLLTKGKIREILESYEKALRDLRYM